MRTYLIALALLLAGPAFGQGMLWEWGQPRVYANNGRMLSYGNVMSAVCLDSLIALSSYEDSMPFTTSADKLHLLTYLNYQGEQVRQYRLPPYWTDYEEMVRLSDTSFIILGNFNNTAYGNPRNTSVAKAYGTKGQLLWKHVFGPPGVLTYKDYVGPVVGGGFEIAIAEPDTANPSMDWPNNYYLFDPSGNIVVGPKNLSVWPLYQRIRPRPARRGFLTFRVMDDPGGNASLRKMIVYRTDTGLAETRVDTIPYGADARHDQAEIYPTGDDGFFYHAYGPIYTSGHDIDRYTYVARYDADGRWMWGGRMMHTFISFTLLADGGMLSETGYNTAFNSNGGATDGYGTFSRLRADSSLVWERSYIGYSPDTTRTYQFAFDGRDGGLLYGKAFTPADGYEYPWAGYFTHLGRPLDPTPVQRALAGQTASLRCYPNPARSGAVLHYKLPAGQAAGRLQLIGLDGRPVLEAQAQSRQGQITLPALAPGLYLLKSQAGACRVLVE